MNQSSLIPVATLGSNHSGTLPPPPAECLAQHWKNVETSDLPVAILKAAALEYAYHSTGTLPMKLDLSDDADVPKHAEPDHPIAESSIDAVLRMIDGEKQECLTEWLQLASSDIKRAPYHVLPRLLDHGISNPRHRPMIATITGNRGVWLASRYSEWQWLSDYLLEASSSNDPLWETGSDAQRLSFITELNSQDPAAAATKIHHAWKSETPSFKLSAINTIPPHNAHETWLELAANDPRKEIREHATSTLLAFSSAYRDRALNRARPFVSFQNRKLTLTLPDTFDPAWADDGIKAKSLGKPIGEKAGWLRQILIRIPLNHWPQLTGQKKPVWKLTFHEDWDQLISESLHAAALNTKHTETLASYILYLTKTKSPHSLAPIITAFTALCDHENKPETLNSLIGKIDDTTLINHMASNPSIFQRATKTVPYILKQISASNTDKPPYLTRPQTRKLALAIPSADIEPTLLKISKFKKLNTATEEFANQLEFRLSYIKSLTNQI